MSISAYRIAELRRAVKRADPTIFENAIRFLHNDSIGHRTGYSKEIVWRYIRRYSLNDVHIQRLEQAAFKCLTRPMSAEFKYMCQTMAHIGTDAFWKQVENGLQSDNPIVQINSYCLYAYSEGIYAGEKQRLALKEINFQLRVAYHTFYPAYSVKELVALIEKPENWPDGIACYQQPYAVDLPVLNFGHNDDALITSLNVAMSNKTVVMRNLREVLSTGVLHPEVINAWIYAIFLLEQLDYPEAVSVLVDFMNQKLDFIPNSYYKQYVAQTVHRVFSYYGTPEAIEAIKQLEVITKHHCYATIDTDHTE